VPITMGQLHSKRDEFWETAPLFEGRREIWDAIKAAATAAENLDFTLAQAILDGANIYIPFGNNKDIAITIYIQLHRSYECAPFEIHRLSCLSSTEGLLGAEA
jgi:hypothetical protein